MRTLRDFVVAPFPNDFVVLNVETEEVVYVSDKSAWPKPMPDYTAMRKYSCSLLTDILDGPRRVSQKGNIRAWSEKYMRGDENGK